MQYAKVRRAYVNILTTVCSELPTLTAIRAGVKARNGRIVLAGAEACARDLGRKRHWDEWASGCSDVEYVSIARTEMELGKVYCEHYSQ
jgi:hypothetical protein